MTQGLSVIICCYNSATRISKTLNHIAAQKVAAHVMWEVIIVNNNSTDNTAEKAKEEWQTYNNPALPFKIVNEAKAGLSFARAKGVSEASFDIILFCDDDNWLDDDYVLEAFNIFSNNSSIGIAGGISKAFCQVTPPYWFDKYSIHFAVGGKPEPGFTTNVTGAGMCIHKNVYASLMAANFKPQLSDRKGASLSSGGDDELCMAARLLGFQVYYSTKLRFTHYMPANRLNWQYFSKLYTIGFAWSGVIIELYNQVYNNQQNLHKTSSEAAYKYIKQKTAGKLLNKISTPLQLSRFIKALFVINEGNDYALKCKLAFNRYMLVRKNKTELLNTYDDIRRFVENAAPIKKNVKITA